MYPKGRVAAAPLTRSEISVIGEIQTFFFVFVFSAQPVEVGSALLLPDGPTPEPASLPSAAAVPAPARLGGGAVTSQSSGCADLGPFRSVSLKQDLARGNSWHNFMEAVGGKGAGGRRGLLLSPPCVPPSDNPSSLTSRPEPLGAVAADGRD